MSDLLQLLVLYACALSALCFFCGCLNCVISVSRFMAFTTSGGILGLCEIALVTNDVLAFEAAYGPAGCMLFAFLDV